MQLFGWVLSLQKAAQNLAPVWDNPRAWWPIIREPFTGAWQRNMEERPETILSHPAVFRCITIIASDIAKLRIKLMEKDGDGIWAEVFSPSFSPVLKKPNHYQNRIQFLENWMISKMIRGNTYVLKQRDERGVVVGLYVLDPNRVTPLVGQTIDGIPGDVYYQLQVDNLSGIPEGPDGMQAVPASEIIHDRCNTLFHPLVGLSPLYAAGLSALHGLKIQQNSTRFFDRGAVPSGVITGPHHIPDDTARRMKEHWDTNYTRENVGKVAVLGDNLKFEQMVMKSTDAQLIEQLKWSAEAICMAYGVPAYKIGAAPIPALGSVEAIERTYYSQCLQIHIESVEENLDEGLGLHDKKDGKTYGVELEIDNLLRMDSKSQIDTLVASVGAGIESPNEARAVINRKPVAGGESPLAQQQNYTLAALASRKQAPGDPATEPALPSPAVSADEQDEDDDDDVTQNDETDTDDDEAKSALTFYELRRELFSEMPKWG